MSTLFVVLTISYVFYILRNIMRSERVSARKR